MLIAVGGVLRLAAQPGRGRRGRRRGARLADGLLHARPRRGARGRVQGRAGDAAGARRDPVDRARVRQGRVARPLRAARAGGLRARRADGASRRSSASSTCAGSSAIAAPTGVTNPLSRNTEVAAMNATHEKGSSDSEHEQRFHQRRRVATSRTRSASRSSASATARARSCRASSTTATPTRSESVPGLMHVDLGGYHVRDIEFTAAFDIDADKVGKDLSEAIFAGQNNTLKFADDVPKLGVEVQRGMTHDGLGKYLTEKITKAPGPTADIVEILKDTHDRRRRLLPPGRLRAGDQVVRRAGARGGLRVRQLHPGVHRPRGLLEQALQEGRAADRRRRHQVAGRRDDRPPRAGPAVPRPRREAAAHLAAERRRQHGLLQHARARAARVQEDLQDQRRHLDHGPRRCPPTTSTSARPTTCRG